MQNLLLDGFSDVPDFAGITPEQVQPAIKYVLADNLARIEQLLLAAEPTWENTIAPLEELDNRLHEAWSCVGHLNAVVSTPALREAHNACLPQLTEYNLVLGQHDGLYQACQRIAKSPTFAALTRAQRTSINNSLLDFTLSGIALNTDQRAVFSKLSQELSRLCSTFEDNVLDATDAWQLPVSAQQLAGVPELTQVAAAEFAHSKGHSGYLLGLNFPCYHAILTYATDRNLREQMYSAYVTRASDQASARWDNGPVMVDILRHRLQLARLLGYPHHAACSVQKKMVKQPQQIHDFLQQLVTRAKPRALQELQQLTDFARQQGLEGPLQAWDVAFYSERLRQTQYAIAEEELRPYFPMPTVLDGLFTLTQRLYGVTITEHVNTTVWHDSVRFFHVTDKDGTLRAQFYMDLYARPHKRGGAWMDECRARRLRQDHTVQIPIALLNCNFAPPTGDAPALLTHDEVVTLFHEFGHGLHHMLTAVDYPQVSGINGVPWDAVELPSQFHEQWCWQAEVLPLISAHYQTGETLPQVMIERLLASRNFQSAMHMLRQLEFALFDMQIHSVSDVDTITSAWIEQTLAAVRQQVAVLLPPAYNRFQHSFSHIFAGGYAAGYYSYKWAEVLASDAFARFEEEGLFNPEVGRAFLQTILERGGEQEPMELFTQFRGRSPQIDALLRHAGIDAS